MWWYVIDIEPDDDGTFLVTVPDFPEITTHADTAQEAATQAAAAIEEAMAARIAENKAIPPPQSGAKPKTEAAALSALTDLKFMLYVQCRVAGVNRAELSRRLGWRREQVDRLFRLDHNSRLDQLEKAFKAINRPMPFSDTTKMKVEPAA